MFFSGLLFRLIIWLHWRILNGFVHLFRESRAVMDSIADLRYHEKKTTTKHMPANKWKDWTEHLRETMCCTPDIGISCASLQGWQWEFPHLHGRKNQAGNQKDKQTWAVYWIHVQPQSDWISSYKYLYVLEYFKIVFVTLWLFNIATENYQFIDDSWWFTY